jgi:hypothetical protein
MPKRPEGGVLAWVVPCALVLGLVAGLVAWVGLFAAAGIVVAFALMFEHGRRRAAAIRRERVGDSICTFARSFDRCSVDPWILRATWEEFACIGYPMRATDRVEEHIHPDDCDDIVEEIAARAGRSLDDTESNPMFDRVCTVRDGVLFLQHQSRSATAGGGEQ